MGTMLYEGDLYRPPSEADSLILQATIGCSWNRCVYCDMYRDKTFRVRPVEEILAHIELARRQVGPRVTKIFVADGDALTMDMGHWVALLDACRGAFAGLRRVSCYAWAPNVLAKTQDELAELRRLGLSLFYVGPESGDEVTLRRIGKGADHATHVAAARRTKAAGIKQSLIFLLGAGGIDRSQDHASASARLATEMDPEFLSALTLTVIPGTPIARMTEKGLFALPSVEDLLRELRTIVAECAPRDAIFRTNHASNYLPLAGRLPRDRDRIVAAIDAALAGDAPLRPEWSRGL